MIPVLGIPILTGPDLLNKMLRSVTLPVDHLVIIDNGKVVEEIKTSAEKVDIVQMPNNVGVAQAWNLIIKSTPRPVVAHLQLRHRVHARSSI
jgi:GT2 family glycosyltransferase